MNWRLSTPELLRIIGNGTPKVLISGDALADQKALLKQQDTSIQYWFEFGPLGDMSFERLIEKSNDNEPINSDLIGDDDPFLFFTLVERPANPKEPYIRTNRSGMEC